MKNQLKIKILAITLAALSFPAITMAATSAKAFSIKYVSSGDPAKDLSCISSGGVSVGGSLCVPKGDPALYSGILLGQSGTIAQGSSITFYGSGANQLFVETTKNGTVSAINKSGSQFKVSVNNSSWSSTLKATKSNVLYIKTS